jgi:hypothetical protein
LTDAANAVKLELGDQREGRTMANTGNWGRRGALALAMATALAPAGAWAQPSNMAAGARPVLDVRGSIFKCDDGGELFAQFTTQGADFVAIVQAGDGPHVLPILPWLGGEPRITWSDGVRTLTWNPGVQLMWMDGVSHRMCGRDMDHHH